MAYKRKPYRTGLEEGYRLGYEAACRLHAPNGVAAFNDAEAMVSWTPRRDAHLNDHINRNKAEGHKARAAARKEN